MLVGVVAMIIRGWIFDANQIVMALSAPRPSLAPLFRLHGGDRDQAAEEQYQGADQSEHDHVTDLHGLHGSVGNDPCSAVAGAQHCSRFVPLFAHLSGCRTELECEDRLPAIGLGSISAARRQNLTGGRAKLPAPVAAAAKYRAYSLLVGSIDLECHPHEARSRTSLRPERAGWGC